MQLASFDAAVRLILRGPADQPLMRILKVALDLADCPIGIIGVRTEDRFRIFVSTGMPLAGFRLDLERTEELARRLREPCLIDDAATEPAFGRHPYVMGPPFWRFIASVPLPLHLLPYPVLLMCCDPRVGHPRRAGLLERLVECAAIAADELSLIGDIAVQEEAIAETRATSVMRDEGVRKAGVPMALVDGEGMISIANERLRALAGLDGQTTGTPFASLFPLDELAVARRLDQVLNDGIPVSGITAQLRGPMARICGIDMIRVVSTDSSQPVALCTVTDRTRTLAETDRLIAPQPDSPSVITEFLLRTLISQQRLLRRGPVPYHALRRWRASVRDVQISALKALKRDPSEVFVNAVAEELAAAARSLYGDTTLQAVVAVPCGNSGPDCFASRLAPAVAARLGLPHIAAFEPLTPSGGSHPQGNVRREKMRLAIPVDRPVLLIDDVATSGQHIAEAAMTLKESGTPAVLPLAWIAAS